MIDILVYMGQQSQAEQIKSAFDPDYYSLRIVSGFREISDCLQSDIYDLAILWLTDQKEIDEFLKELREQNADYIPTIVVLDSGEEISDIIGTPGISDLIQLPISKPEFHEIVKAIVFSEQGRQRNNGVIWEGSLSDFNLVDLLQFVESESDDLQLFANHAGFGGQVYISQGLAIDATLAGYKGVAALKRLAVWREGYFQLKPAVGPKPDATIDQAQDALLLMLFENITRLDNLMDQLPEIGVKLVRNRAVEGGQLNLLQNSILDSLSDPVTISEIPAMIDGEPVEVLAAVAGLYQSGVLDDYQKVNDSVADESVGGQFGKMLSSFKSLFNRNKDKEQEKLAYRFFDSGPENEGVVVNLKRTRLNSSEVEKISNKVLGISK